MCTVKHAFHASDRCCIPLFHGWVEVKCIAKHPVHVSHRRHIPTTQSLIEGVCITKHSIRCGHQAHGPTRNVFIEGLKDCSLQMNPLQKDVDSTVITNMNIQLNGSEWFIQSCEGLECTRG